MQNEPETRRLDIIHPLDELARLDFELRRQRSVSLFYTGFSGSFMAAALWYHDERLAIPVFLIFMAWLWLRYRVLARHRSQMIQGFADLAEEARDSAP